ncbi:hypothetical protein L1987_69570 [Smallanthus sonchifolius]|uniref:Uncharacterized protein n=1 Tax=Smallanthus sonchifolius TaxID=185202 RepID=A0ACB9BAQ8_9ASTR|nr:hypothetical protein L1987_69570 [Smallanthus sonchifolius]
MYPVFKYEHFSCGLLVIAYPAFTNNLQPDDFTIRDKSSSIYNRFFGYPLYYPKLRIVFGGLFLKLWIRKLLAKVLKNEEKEFGVGESC